MRKIVFTVVLLTAMCFVAASCLEDEGNTTKMSTTYVGRCVDIVFTQDVDTPMRSVIVTAFENLGLDGEKSMFTEHVELDYNSMSAARIQCDIQALNTYNTKVGNITQEELREAIFDAMTSRQRQDYAVTTIDELPLHDFRAALCLYNPTQIAPLDSFYVDYKGVAVESVE